MKVQVVNDNTYPYTEEFKGQKITIEPKGHVEMERDDAVLFLGTFSPISYDVDGNPHPKSYKKLKIVEITDKKKA
jgi:hypothetical protein